jgi:flagellar motor switch protein FliN/FliY
MEDQGNANVPSESEAAENLMREVGIPPDDPASSPPVENDDKGKAGEEMVPGLDQEALNEMLKDFGGGESAELGGGANAAPPEVQKADFQQLSAISGEKVPQNIELLMDVDLPVSIELGHTKMSIAEILALGPGSIVELDKLVGEPVDLLVNQKCVARGEVVVVEESFGLRITQLMSPEERIKNLK